MPDTARDSLSWDENPSELIKIGKAMYENDILPQIPHAEVTVS